MNCRRHLSSATCAAGLLVVAAVGCGSKDDFEFDELDMTPAQDELIEFSLGKYVIPIPLLQVVDVGRWPQAKPRRVRVRAATPWSPADCKKQPRRHSGSGTKASSATASFSFAATRPPRICRNPSSPRSSPILTDAVHAELGSNCIRRLLISEVVTRKL